MSFLIMAGSAGPKRFNLPISMAIMDINNDINVSFINLEQV